MPISTLVFKDNYTKFHSSLYTGEAPKSIDEFATKWTSMFFGDGEFSAYAKNITFTTTHIMTTEENTLNIAKDRFKQQMITLCGLAVGGSPPSDPTQAIQLIANAIEAYFTTPLIFIPIFSGMTGHQIVNSGIAPGFISACQLVPGSTAEAAATIFATAMNAGISTLTASAMTTTIPPVPVMDSIMFIGA